VTLFASNVLAGVDQLLHGSAGLRGWGNTPSVDATLLVPRGFDATAQRFRYEVNPRFAETRPNLLATRNPFTLTLDVSLALHVDYDVQQLRLALEPVKINGRWQQRSVDSLLAVYLRETSSLHRSLIAQSDSLFLTRPQLERLVAADSVFAEETRGIFRPLAEFLSTSGNAAGKAALDSVKATETRYWKLFWRQPEIADSIVTPLQRQFAASLGQMLATSPKEREDSRWFFGHTVPVVHRRPPELPEDFRGSAPR
jgi:hypothetical protein